MKAILIDPFTKTVTLVDADFDKHGTIGQFLAQGALGPLQVCLDSSFRVAHGYHSYVDDDGCYREGQQWFWLKGAICATAGRMVILADRFVPDSGIHEGDVDERLLEPVRQLVRWVSPEEGQASMPPTTVSSFDPVTGKTELISSNPIDFSQRRTMEKTSG